MLSFSVVTTRREDGLRYINFSYLTAGLTAAYSDLMKERQVQAALCTNDLLYGKDHDIENPTSWPTILICKGVGRHRQSGAMAGSKILSF